jgi:hypothetical protein
MKFFFEDVGYVEIAGSPGVDGISTRCEPRKE